MNFRWRVFFQSVFVPSARNAGLDERYWKKKARSKYGIEKFYSFLLPLNPDERPIKITPGHERLQTPANNPERPAIPSTGRHDTA